MYSKYLIQHIYGGQKSVMVTVRMNFWWVHIQSSIKKVIKEKYSRLQFLNVKLFLKKKFSAFMEYIKLLKLKILYGPILNL